MKASKLTLLTANDASWALRMIERLRERSPAVLQTLGPAGLLDSWKAALFCSVRAPGNVILLAHDAARQLRDDGITVISGFHSQIEKDCLRILLRGTQPIIVCPARSLHGMRIPPQCKTAFDAGRLLYLSPFLESPRRVARDLALIRNSVVAALAEEVVFAYIDPNGELARLQNLVAQWNTPHRILTGSRNS